MKKVDWIKHPTGDIKQKGFGIIPKLVMQDKRLSIEAKAIYAYMASYAGAGDTAFPGVELMKDHLGVSEKRFYKYRKELVDLGYITVIRTRNEDGNRRGRNIYTLNQILSQPSQNDSVEDFEHGRFESVQTESVQIEHVQNGGTNSNSLLKSTALNNNSLHHHQKNEEDEEDKKPKGPEIDKELGELAKLYQECIGQVDGRTPSWLKEILEEYGFLWCKNALIRADEYGGRTKAYVRSILNRWKTNGGMKLEVKNDERTGGSTEGQREADEYMQKLREKGYLDKPESEDIDF